MKEKKHPVELTREEISAMSLEELKSFRDKSLKVLEDSLDMLADKKKKEDYYLKEAMDIISKTCLGLHRRIEVLERFVQELLSDKAFEELKEGFDKEKLN
ncbi:uncharacterized protein METZ01_LOCUS123793 [marine metagenome]|uniref:Nucleotide exchange factor GrpE n=1 Tax=marine metagenome TaxID=408172 RepID=A0A381Y1L1_9ZZZZ|tara:strand:+ start:1617 stop:1916 length:300 start_codon:yes stop_codon:yes gene_type:complete